MVGGEVGNKISKLCANQATQDVLVNGSAETVVAHWDGEKENG